MSAVPARLSRRYLLEEHNLRDLSPYNIFLSSLTVYKSIHVLHELGITAVLNLVSNEENPTITEEYRKEGLCVLHLPMFDNEEFKLDTVLTEACDFIDDQLKSDRKILVHCAMGLSRAPSVVMGYFITKMEMTYEDAYIKCGGYSYNRINDGFLSQLKELARTSVKDKE